MKCSSQKEATIVYATHIFDGLETWATDVAYIQEGELRKSARYSDIEELKGSKNLLSVVESWLRSETKLPKKEEPQRSEAATQPRRFSFPFISAHGLLPLIMTHLDTYFLHFF
jgi:CCR4-NOT complex subunit CAF16